MYKPAGLTIEGDANRRRTDGEDIVFVGHRDFPGGWDGKSGLIGFEQDLLVGEEYSCGVIVEQEEGFAGGVIRQV